MTSLKKIVTAAGLAASIGAFACLTEPASAMPTTGLSPIVAEHAQADAPLPIEHVQYYGGYGYGYPCVFPYRCGYGRRFGYYGGGFYGRGFYGRGYGRGFYGRGGFRR